MVWKKGQSGNPGGQAKGTKQNINADFLHKLAHDFKVNGKAAIEKMRKDDNTQYVKVVAALVPKDYNINQEADKTFDELLSQTRLLTAELERRGVDLTVPQQPPTDKHVN